MKRIYNKACVAALGLVALTACSQVDYDGEYSKEGYYSGANKVAFAFRATSDTAQHYSFGLKSLDTLTHTGYFRVNLVGNIVSQDRVFKIEVDPSSTAIAGIHYTALPETFVMPADSTKAYIPIELIRKDIGSTGLDTLKLVLRLVPTDDFQANITQFVRLGDYDKYYVYNNKVTITFDNTPTPPSYWSYFEVNWRLNPFTLERYLLFQKLLNNRLDEVVAAMNNGDMDAMSEFYLAMLEVNKI